MKYYILRAIYAMSSYLKVYTAPVTTSRYNPMTQAWCICLEGVTLQTPKTPSFPPSYVGPQAQGGEGISSLMWKILKG